MAGQFAYCSRFLVCACAIIHLCQGVSQVVGELANRSRVFRHDSLTDMTDVLDNSLNVIGHNAR